MKINGGRKSQESKEKRNESQKQKMEKSLPGGKSWDSEEKKNDLQKQKKGKSLYGEKGLESEGKKNESQKQTFSQKRTCTTKSALTVPEKRTHTQKKIHPEVTQKSQPHAEKTGQPDSKKNLHYEECTDCSSEMNSHSKKYTSRSDTKIPATR